MTRVSTFRRDHRRALLNPVYAVVYAFTRARIWWRSR